MRYISSNRNLTIFVTAEIADSCALTFAEYTNKISKANAINFFEFIAIMFVYFYKKTVGEAD
ncbi:hypothetical protein RGT18_13930 [Solobacterium moorei]|nr:hypothetical protein RGT18_13930 [Solobacterium moorei]